MVSYQQLKVWQHAVELMTEVYELTKDKVKKRKHKRKEQTHLIEEIRNCAENIASSIEEGSKKTTFANFLAYLKIADRASMDLDFKLRLAKDLGALTSERINSLLNKIEVLQKELIVLRQPIEFRLARK